MPLVLLREDDFSGQDLQMALAAAARDADLYGSDPDIEHLRVIRSTPDDHAVFASTPALLALLRAALPLEIIGYGVVKALRIYTSRQSPEGTS